MIYLSKIIDIITDTFFNYIQPFSSFLGSLYEKYFDGESVLANVIGGLILVVILFLWKETFNRRHNLTGEWEVINTVLETSYNPYLGLKVVWKMHILQNGNNISGSGEKIKDIEKIGIEKELEHSKRDSVEIEGYIENNYLRKNRLFISVKQDGQLRKTRATYTLYFVDDNNLSGGFISTAADTKGKSIFSRNF
mgnify:CR=1 FL=1